MMGNIEELREKILELEKKIEKEKPEPITKEEIEKIMEET